MLDLELLENAVFPTTPEEITALLDRANHGDPAALPYLRSLLESQEYVDTFCGNMALEVQEALVQRHSRASVIVREALLRQLQIMRNELGGSYPEPLERLLVDRVVLCWLHLHLLEVECARNGPEAQELGACYHEQLDRAQRRYLAAIKTLAVVCKSGAAMISQAVARAYAASVGESCKPTPALDQETLEPVDLH